MKSILRILAVAFVALGLLAAAAGAALGAGVGWAWSRAVRAEGMVVQMVRVRSPEDPGPLNRPSTGTPAYVPEVQYVVGGEKYRIRGRVPGSNESYDIGAAVGVLYPPDRPADGWIDSFAEQWRTPVALGGGGLACALVGLALLRSRTSAPAIPPAAGE